MKEPTFFQVLAQFSAVEAAYALIVLFTVFMLLCVLGCGVLAALGVLR